MLEDRYCLQYPDGDFVAVDMSSGGYPYGTRDPNAIKFWRNKDIAYKYSKSFPELKLVKVRFDIGYVD